MPVNKNLTKILIIRLSSLGDIVLSFPLINLLKKNYPGSSVHFIVKKKYEDVLKLNPYIDNIIPYENHSVTSSRKKIMQGNYDLIIDLHGSIKSYLLTVFSRVKVLRIKKNSVKKLIFVRTKINFFKEITPVYKKYLNTVRNLINVNDTEFESRIVLEEFRSKFDFDYIVLSPSSRHFTKTLPKEKFEWISKNISEFEKYINTLNTKTISKKDIKKKIILVGDNSEKDKEICAYLESIPDSDNVLNLCGKLNFQELSVIIKNCSYVICNDSGIMHLAEVLGKNVIAFFGSTVKEFGFFPQRKDSIVIENNKIKCRPCSHIGKAKCPKKHFDCMNSLINFT